MSASSDPFSEAEAQYRAGAHNRRVALDAENLVRAGASSETLMEVFCTCGRADCDEVIVMSVAQYRFVRERPYRFVVAPEHQTETDDVVLRTDGYSVVEIREPYRLAAEP
jgi:hypothetical protein